ncbi:MAG: NfeD family protein [candidate division NC10 bacterium]|nr:NfeD family protein [candidate division NC10 bacterium]
MRGESEMGNSAGGQRPLTKYLLIQTPGWILVAVGLWGLRQWIDLPLWAAFGLFLLWVVKDLILFPLLRPIYESGGKGGANRLIGAKGIAEEPLAPSGYIRVGGELWRAEAMGTDKPIPPGSRVRVLAIRGLTLLIQPEE